MCFMFKIQLMMLNLGLLIALDSNAGLVATGSQQNARLRITNQCAQTIWIQQDFKSSTGDPIVVEIPKSSSYDYSIPDQGLASTRFWPKTGCNSHGYDCSLGESTGVPDAEVKGYQHGPYAPDINSKFEATWGCLQAIFSNNPSLCAANPSSPANHLNAETWWNGSAVDGYTLPYQIAVKNHNGSCMDIVTGKPLSSPGVNCGQLKADACPSDANLSTEGKYNIINGVNVTHVNLKWLDAKTGKAIGCFSPCSKLTTAQGSDNGQTGGGWRTILGGLTPQSPAAQMYCCPTPPISPGVCSAGPAARSSYSLSVHSGQLCDSYTYAYDDAKGLARCGAQTQFEITFCPSAQPTPAPTPLTVSMKMIVPIGVAALLDGVPLNTNQMVTVNNNAVLSISNSTKPSCILSVNQQLVVSATSGSLCSQVLINNTDKSITFPNLSPTPSSYSLQFNMNTSVGISAYLNGALIVNATPIDSKTLPKNSVLTAYQGTKQGSCNLTVNTDAVVKGSGELCVRLNIVKESASKIHIYLPADIPNTGNVAPNPINTTKTLVFGMASGIYAKFNNQVITNGSEIILSNIPDSKNLDLVAIQNQNTANCILGKTGDILSIIPNSGVLCNSGLVLLPKSNGDYYIGLPNPIPASSGSKLYGLGIASGMKITLNGVTVAWNTPSKTMNVANGVNNFIIIGANKTQRTCPITRYGDVLSWPKTAVCAGVVLDKNVIYFPAF